MMRNFLARCAEPERYAIAAPEWGVYHTWSDREHAGRRYPYYRLWAGGGTTFGSRRVGATLSTARRAGDLRSFDVVFSHAPELLLPLLLRGFRGRAVLHVIGNLTAEVRFGRHRVFGSPGLPAAYRELAFWVMRRCHRVLWVDPNAMEATPPDIRARSEQLSTLYDDGVFHPPEQFARNEEPLLVWVSRLTPLKRVDAALRAVQLAGSRGLRWRIAICGTGDSELELRRLTVDLGIGDRVDWLGGVGHAELAELMRRADAGLLLSAAEGSPSVVKEMLASGLPVVATRVGDNSLTIRDGVNGRLVDDPTPEAVVEAVSSVLGMPDPARRAAADPVRRWSVENWVATLETAFGDG